MNTSLQILLTVLLVGGGIGGYHLLTADSAPDAVTPDGPDYARQITALEERLEALEDRGPLLQGTVDAQALWEQMHRLGERLEAVEKAPPAAGRSEVSADVTEVPGAERDLSPADGRVAAADGEPSPLTEAEERRVRQLLDGAMRDRMQDWANRRMDRTLSELGIELTADQREKLNAVLGEHMQAVRETFRKAREDGVPREERGALLAPLTEQLTQKMAEFLPINDAEAISKALPAMGRGPGGGRGGGGPR